MTRSDPPEDAPSRARLSDALLRNRRIRGHGAAVIDGDATFDWMAFTDRAMRLGAALQGLGVVAEDRVAILSLNSHRMLEAFFGINWAGGIYTPLNFRLAVPELVEILADCAAEVLIVDAAHAALVPELVAAGRLRHVILAADEAPAAATGLLSYEELLTQSSPAPASLRGGEDVCALFYTSGSTGRPKGVMHTHANVLAMATIIIAHGGFDEQTVFTMPGPLFHVGAAGTMLPVLIAGGTVVVTPRYEPTETADLIRRHGINAMGLVPTMLRMLVDVHQQPDGGLGSVETLIYGAAPMNEALLVDAQRLLPNARFLHWYGLTEVTAAATALPFRYITPAYRHLGRANSIGRAMFGLQVAIVGPDGTELPPGDIGEVAVRGPNVMRGYWNKPEQTAETLRGGRLHTGDLGYMDAEGFVFLVDRLKDMIITGGENVFSIEVEEAIYAYPGVAQCAVIGVPHPKWGEAVHAIVHASPQAGLSAEAILAHCRSRIAGYKIPRSVDLRAEPLPLNGANKINKPLLREPYWEGRTSKLV